MHDQVLKTSIAEVVSFGLNVLGSLVPVSD